MLKLKIFFIALLISLLIGIQFKPQTVNAQQQGVCQSFYNFMDVCRDTEWTCSDYKVYDAVTIGPGQQFLSNQMIDCCGLFYYVPTPVQDGPCKPGGGPCHFVGEACTQDSDCCRTIGGTCTPDDPSNPNNKTCKF